MDRTHEPDREKIPGSDKLNIIRLLDFNLNVIPQTILPEIVFLL